ncbi:hypothetical protein C464_09994 [Halorubrum coriense DSM 10284]|uniref:Uncharacterized protein n=1 Tax=Halorubrum coriense DSM 10284 TaxID=1227466 RepID=M0EGU6_9EURY|nr:hypothetical protein [Halorubrum coriense]ELZ46980.1 hypothetical protein C464_09994 [Halorubrum coriense DSM 10284]
MNRRRLLAACGAGVGTLAGGVAWRRVRGPSVPPGIEAATTHLEADVLFRAPDRDPEFPEWKSEHHTVVPDAAAAEERLVDDGSVAEFVAATDFAESVLIVVQNGMQSEMELVLDAIERVADGLRLDVSVEAPSGGPDDLRTHSLLVRLTGAEPRVPLRVTVDVEGYV